MNAIEISLQAAQSLVTNTLKIMSRRMRERERSETPDESGNFTEAHRTAREIADLIDSVLLAPASVLTQVSPEVAGAFEENPLDGLNRFLQELALGDLLSAPQDIFDQLALAVGEAFETTPRIPSRDERETEISIRYIMQRGNIDRESATKKLHASIAGYTKEYGRPPDHETVVILITHQ